MWMHGGRMWLRGASDEGRSCQILMLSSLVCSLAADLCSHGLDAPSYPVQCCRVVTLSPSVQYILHFFCPFMNPPSITPIPLQPEGGREGGAKDRGSSCQGRRQGEQSGCLRRPFSSLLLLPTSLPLILFFVLLVMIRIMMMMVPVTAPRGA